MKFKILIAILSVANFAACNSQKDDGDSENQKYNQNNNKKKSKLFFEKTRKKYKKRYENIDKD